MPARTWFVTGAARGLGRAIVDAALSRGDTVVATTRQPAALAADLEAHGPRAIVLALCSVWLQCSRRSQWSPSSGGCGRCLLPAGRHHAVAGYGDPAPSPNPRLGPRWRASTPVGECGGEAGSSGRGVGGDERAVVGGDDAVGDGEAEAAAARVGGAAAVAPVERLEQVR
jgi:hypothetical protein